MIGRHISLIRKPDLNLVDAIWVANDNNYDSASAVRCNVVLGSRDPFAVDWYASEYVLRPVVPDYPDESSLARGGNISHRLSGQSEGGQEYLGWNRIPLSIS